MACDSSFSKISDSTLFFPYKSERNFELSYQSVKNIYERMGDDYSKELFLKRIALSLTDSVDVGLDIILSTVGGKKLYEQLDLDDDIWIYGFGKRGQRFVTIHEKNIVFNGFIDQNNKQVGLQKYEVVNNTNFSSELKRGSVIISNLKDYETIYNHLLKEGVNKEKIYILAEYDLLNQSSIYFEERCVERFRCDDGIFIDAGSFDGKDTVNFINSRFYQNNRIIAFEPEENSYQTVKKNLLNYDKVEVIKKGLSDEAGKLRFYMSGEETARITDEGDGVIETCCLDDVCDGKKVSFIKIDIEGGEKRAIIGAQGIIKKYAPNLMISIYHKREDVVELPELILEYNPNYRFLLGHYGGITSVADTVLYAYAK